MRGRGVAFQGLLAALGLTAAFVVWQREPADASGEAVVVLEASRRTLERVRYEDAADWVELVRDRTRGDALWLRLGKKDGEASSVRELRANDIAERLFTRFAPLRAVRSLGVLEAKSLVEVGLVDSPRKLTVTLDSGAHVFPVAASASGWGNPSLRREPDGSVFLLSPSLLPDLENAPWRLVDRTLHVFEAGAYDALTVTCEGTSRAFLVRARPPHAAQLVPRERPDAPDEQARRWNERLWLLAPAQADFLGRGEEPPGGAPREVFRVEYQRGATGLGHLTVARAPGGELYARTEHTVGWARLPPWAESLAQEARQVVGR